MQPIRFTPGVVRERKSFFLERIQRLKDCGVGPEQLILTLVGFGKDAGAQFATAMGVRSFTELGRPGVARGFAQKSFIGKLLGTQPGQRLPAKRWLASVSRFQAGIPVDSHSRGCGDLAGIQMIEAFLAERKEMWHMVQNH